MDGSSGYEAIASEFLRHRSSGIGVQQVRNWVRTLPRGSSVIDLGCGTGFPITSVLVNENLYVFGVDAAPSLVDVFKQNFPAHQYCVKLFKRRVCFIVPSMPSWPSD
jgi:predicted RNA methylase